jgi:L-alanine-DL-glutamate epimerase-like enolase superfamily enzyme
MNQPLRIREVRVHRLQIPLRLRFEHAAAARDTADPVLVQLLAEAPCADAVGIGETLARPYVTGETAETVAEDIREFFVPSLVDFRASSFSEVLEAADGLPTFVEGRLVNAARATVELALIDLGGKVFQRRAADAAQWLELPRFGPPGCLAQTRYSGIVVGRRPTRCAALLRLHRLYGLRDFKLKVAVEGWQARLERACHILRHALAAGRSTLRVDANGGWSLNQALDAVPLLERCGVCAIEQPLPPAGDGQLRELADRTRCLLIADESLRTEEDAQHLLTECGVRLLNVRIAKNGGLLPSLRIAARALAAGCDVQLGCLVGETSVLTAAGIAFLEACPRVRFAEGAFGRFLLRRDVVSRPIRFGWGGRIRPRSGYGLGVAVDESRLDELAADPPIVMHL